MRRSGLSCAAALCFAVGCGGGGGGGSSQGGGKVGDCSGDGDVVCGQVTYDFVPSVYDPTTDTGTLDFAHASPRPVRNAAVVVLQGGSEVGRGVTGEDGAYTVAFHPSGGGALSVVAVAQTTTPPVQVEDNTQGDAIWTLGAAIGTGKSVANLRATHGWTGQAYDPARRLAAPFAILDTMYTAAHAYLAVRPGIPFPLLHVGWSPNNAPQDGDPSAGQIGTSHFDPRDGRILVLGEAGADTDELDREVIAHEWGHYFEANLSRSDSPGGIHHLGTAIDPRLAFGEGYGDAIASILLRDPIYSDTFWDQRGALNGFGWDAENAPAGEQDPTPGAFSELKITRLLYDLWDPPNESFDGLQVDLGTFYDVLTGPERTTEALTTIASFIAGMRSAGVDAATLNTLLEHYQIGDLQDEWGRGDALAKLYLDVPQRTATLAGQFDGTAAFNRIGQVQFFVLHGDGSTFSARAQAGAPVSLEVYRAGQPAAFAAPSTTPSLSFDSQSQALYVLVLTGHGATGGVYDVQLTLGSP